jgi:hypothetical protein
MAEQHALLSDERWGMFTLDERVLIIGNEMNRATKWVRAGDIARLKNCYARVLNLADSTIRLQKRALLRRELLKWRGLIAHLYNCKRADEKAHMAAFKVLLTFTAEASKQRRYVLV